MAEKKNKPAKLVNYNLMGVKTEEPGDYAAGYQEVYNVEAVDQRIGTHVRLAAVDEEVMTYGQFAGVAIDDLLINTTDGDITVATSPSATQIIHSGDWYRKTGENTIEFLTSYDRCGCEGGDGDGVTGDYLPLAGGDDDWADNIC
jgi:hypothetical protein